MNQNFSKVKFYTNHLKWSIFNGGGWGVLKILRYKFRGKFWTSQKFDRFPTIIVFVIFWTEGKNSLDYLERKYGNIG